MKGKKVPLTNSLDENSLTKPNDADLFRFRREVYPRKSGGIRFTNAAIVEREEEGELR